MPSYRLLSLCVLVSVVLGIAVPVEAQIYRCKSGNTWLYTGQPSRCGESNTYAVAGATSDIVVSRPVAKGFANRYDAIIDQAARDWDVRSDLVRAVIQVESGFNPRAKSPKGAMGLMQLMPKTAAEYGVRNAYNPTENIRGGVAYLRSLLDRYQDETLALAAYNAGPTAVDKYGQTVPPYRETQQYVDKVQNITAPEPAPEAGGRGKVIYKSMIMVDGRLMPRYSDTKPAIGPYEIVRH